MTREYSPLLGSVTVLGAAYLEMPGRKLGLEKSIGKELFKKPNFSSDVISSALKDITDKFSDYGLLIFNKYGNFEHDDYMNFIKNSSMPQGEFDVCTGRWTDGAYQRAEISLALKIKEDDKRKEELVKILADWENFVAGIVDEKQKKLVSIITKEGTRNAFPSS